MKTLIRKVGCYLLAGLIFVSSTGFGLVQHSCLMSIREAVSFTSKKPCCGDKKATSAHAPVQQTIVKKAKCCQEEKEYAHVAISSSLVQAMANLLASLCVALISTFSFLFTSLIETITRSIALSASPPLSGRDLLVLLQTFLL